MRHLLVVVLVAVAPACKKKDASSVKLGSSGLALAVVDDASVLVEETKPGFWNLSPAVGNGLTTVEVKYPRGMPTRSYLEGSVREDAAVEAAGRIEDGPNGMLIYSVTRPDKDDRSKPQHFLYAYLPTTDGAALCSGYSSESPNDAHLEVCRKLIVAK